jgi:signal transduction histidine kinase
MEDTVTKGEVMSKSQSLTVLVKAVQELSLARNIDAVMLIVRTAARKLTGADGATFVLRDDGKCYYAEEDAISPLWKGQRFPMNICISGWAMLNRRPAIIEDIYEDDRIPVDAYKPTFVKSLVMVPIRSMDPIGAIGNYWARKRQPTEEEVMMLQSLADITAVTMENIQVYNQLEQLVTERTRELIESLDREKEMNAAKTRLVSMASHEFKTPLTAILSSSSLLERYDGPDISEKRVKHYSQIKSSVKNLVNILDDFLNVDKMELGKAETRYETFDLKAFVEEVMEEMQIILKNGQHFRYTHSGDTFSILQDNKILRNVLVNLLSNASKYSAEHNFIDVSSSVMQGQVVIEVQDHGIGIPEEDQQYIFTDFFRAKNAADIKGTGLGLNIVKRYMDLINGSISFSSMPGQGTTFTIRFKDEHTTA